MTETPELKSFGDLSAGDFVRHPVWVNCHTVDDDEPWYDDTDEETFRPFQWAVASRPRDGIYLVSAVATLADGTVLPGFITPASPEGGLGDMQPYVFAGDSAYGFWGGMLGVAEAYRNGLYAAVGKDEAAVFPLHVAARPNLTTGVSEAWVAGWISASS